MTIKLDDETMIAKPGSVFVLLRTLPLTLETGKNLRHSHCSVQLISDFDFAIAKNKEEIPKDYEGLVLPFVTPGCPETENVKKQLFAIVSELSVSRERSGFSSALSAMGILEVLNSKLKKDSLKDFHISSLLTFKIKKYVSEHLNRGIALSEISAQLGKTAIYLNSVFKTETGTTIHQYINSEKMRFVAELMSTKGLDFRSACESAGISDVSYGYLLFKKQMGITPGEYKNSWRFLK